MLKSLGKKNYISWLDKRQRKLLWWGELHVDFCSGLLVQSLQVHKCYLEVLIKTILPVQCLLMLLNLMLVKFVFHHTPRVMLELFIFLSKYKLLLYLIFSLTGSLYWMENWFAGEKCGSFHINIILEIRLNTFRISSFTDFIQLYFLFTKT